LTYRDWKAEEEVQLRGSEIRILSNEAMAENERLSSGRNFEAWAKSRGCGLGLER
jgi:hypothetical protein